MVTHPSYCSGFKNYKNTNSFYFIALNSSTGLRGSKRMHPTCSGVLNVTTEVMSQLLTIGILEYCSILEDRLPCRFVPGSQRNYHTDVGVMDSFLRVVLAR